jgi:UDP-hydrolysing UDP-N-acetyl-D-glucosamine 2-epimerase
VTFHPVTAEGDSAAQCRELLAALDALGSDIGLVFTGANADVEGRMLNRLVGEFVAARENAVLHASLGPHRYYGALRHADAVVGNSSSGLYEAPSFGIPTVNIGSRQDGRLRAASVIDCRAERDAIGAAIARALQMQRGGVTNPYGDGHAAERIVGVLKRLDDPRTLLKKRFVDWMPA